jgi:hypothetical protein
MSTIKGWTGLGWASKKWNLNRLSIPHSPLLPVSSLHLGSRFLPPSCWFPCISTNYLYSKWLIVAEPDIKWLSLHHRVKIVYILFFPGQRAPSLVHPDPDILKQNLIAGTLTSQIDWFQGFFSNVYIIHCESWHSNNRGSLSYKRAANQVSKVLLIRPNGGSRLIEIKIWRWENALCGRLLPHGYMTKLTA